MTMKAGVLFFSGLILLTGPAFGHGEDKPGPHGGEIRMPGAFHTEVKQRGREFQVFLLDLAFKDPQTTDSNVEMKVVRAGAEAPIEMTCRATRAAKPPHFVCLNATYTAKEGDMMKVQAKRLGSVGVEVEYKMPLLKASEKNPAKVDARKAASMHDHANGHNHEKSGEESHSDHGTH